MDWSTIYTSLMITGIVALVGAIGTLLKLVYSTYRKIGALEEMEDRRFHENLLQFKAIFALIRCARTGQNNGELKEAEKDLNDYLRDKAMG